MKTGRAEQNGGTCFFEKHFVTPDREFSKRNFRAAHRFSAPPENYEKKMRKFSPRRAFLFSKLVFLRKSEKFRD
jgi:hypothetical protein